MSIIDGFFSLFYKLEMSTLPLLTDCLRLIALHLDNVDIDAMSCVCRQFNRAISSNEFWKAKIEKDFGIPVTKITTISEKYALPHPSARTYYHRYATTRTIDALIRTWISDEDMTRFYSAMVRFFRKGGPEMNWNLTKNQRRYRRICRMHRPSRPNDIWIYGRANTGKTAFMRFLINSIGGFVFISDDPWSY